MIPESESSDDSRISMIPQGVESEGYEFEDVTNSIKVIRQDVEFNVDECNNDLSTNSIPGTPQEMELEGSDIGSNSIPETPHEIELVGDDIRSSIEETELVGDDIRSSIEETDYADVQANSILVIRQEMDSNGGDLRRNSIACIPQEMEPEAGDIRRNSIIVISAGVEATGADIRRRSIARNIQSRYLRASMGSCHDYCKYGKDENVEASPKAERKRTSTINSKPSPYSCVKEKSVISVTKQGAASSKKVSSYFKEVNVPMESSIHSRGKCAQVEPSSNVKPSISHETSPDYEAQVLYKSLPTEKQVVSVTKKTTVSVEKEIDVTVEDSPEKLESSPLTRSVHSMRDSEVVSGISSKSSQDSETRKLCNSAVIEKKAILVKKKDTGSSKDEIHSFVPMGEHGSCHKGEIGKDAPDCSSIRGNKSIRNHNRRASLSGGRQTMEMHTVSLSFKHFNKRDSNVNTGSSYNLKGLSHVKNQNDLGKFEPEPPSGKDMPEKILYVIESSTENNIEESTLDGASVPKPLPSSPVSVKGKSQDLDLTRKGIGRTGSSPSLEKINLKRVNRAHSRSAGLLDQDYKGLRHTRGGTQASLSPSSSSKSMSISSFESTNDKLDGANPQLGTGKNVILIGNSKVQHKTTPGRSKIVGSANQNSVPRKLAFRRGRVVELQPENSTPRRLNFRRANLAMEGPNSKGSTTSGSIRKKEVVNRQSNGIGIIKRVNIVRREVGDRQSDCVATKRAIIGKKEVEDQRTNDAGMKKASILKKKVIDRQPNGVIKRGVTGSKEVDDYKKNGAKIKSENVVLRNQEQVEVSPRKSLRRNKVSVGVLNGIRSNPEKVVLRHQDVKGKKDDQKLFNNVIEETANKLAETRKSKVKALVGAFETVISLQDKRPAATVDAR